MNNKTILELYRRLDNNNHTSKEEQKALSEFCEMHSELEKMIPEDARPLLNKIIDMTGKLNLCSEENAFINGFKLGMRIAIESMTE